MHCQHHSSSKKQKTERRKRYDTSDLVTSTQSVLDEGLPVGVESLGVPMKDTAAVTVRGSSAVARLFGVSVAECVRGGTDWAEPTLSVQLVSASYSVVAATTNATSAIMAADLDQLGQNNGRTTTRKSERIPSSTRFNSDHLF